jgi:peptide-methionine (S)-S-oxide reductase
METATLGGGCFWCLEAVYLGMDGVESVVSGYMGGHVPNPSYEQVCTGRTGHAEVVQVRFDPAITSYREILDVLFAIHDPTTLNRQGNDVGPQYRSVIFTHTDEQRRIAEETVRPPMVTEVRPAETFYPAETYHQNYFENNPAQPYCAYVVAPKVKKFRETFAAKLKSREGGV